MLYKASVGFQDEMSIKSQVGKDIAVEDLATVRVRTKHTFIKIKFELDTRSGCVR